MTVVKEMDGWKKETNRELRKQDKLFAKVGILPISTANTHTSLLNEEIIGIK